ncbi:hypothetical protein ACI8AA_01370 [Geodermatophilus sp. SYSU D01180]
MPLPFLPVVIGLAVTGLAGSGAGVHGVSTMVQAQGIVSGAQRRHDAAHQRHCRARGRTADALERYGYRRIEVQTTTIAEWVAWLERNQRKVRRLRHTTVGGIPVAVPSLPQLRVVVADARGLLAGGAAAAVGAMAAQQAALAGVRTLAVAGTGAAISGLSGAAAESATLAWLGGGTLAAGGGGVAAGGIVLTGVALAPALLIGGITLAVQGDQALTQAHRYDADVTVAIEEMRLQERLLRRLNRRIREIRSVLAQLDERARVALALLSALDFDPAVHAEAFQRTALLMTAVGEVLDTPLLDADGQVSRASSDVMERHAP